MNKTQIFDGLKATEDEFLRGLALVKQAAAAPAGCEVKDLLKMAINAFENSEAPYDQVMNALSVEVGQPR